MSNLNFNNTEAFRKKLLLRNLDESYGFSSTLPVNFTDSTYGIQGTSDSSVIDQSDVGTTAGPIMDANLLLNEFNKNFDYKSYLSGINIEQYSGLISVITGDDTGEEDTELIQIARATLKNIETEVIGNKLREATVGRINTDVTGLLTGREKLVERDYQITVPGNPITRSAEYLARVSGAELPVSYIPGTFFEDNIEKGKVEGFLDKAGQAIGQALNLDFNSHKKTYSQKLLKYTSGGQKSRLFTSVNYNKYQPAYDTSTDGPLNNAIDTLQGLAGLDPTNGAFYMGTPDVDPGTIFTLDGASTSEKGFMVSGPSKMVKMFEGDVPLNTFPENDSKYLNGTAPKNTETQFVWLGDKDPVRGEINSVGVQSNEKTIKPDTLLGKTQEIVQDASQLEGEARLKHPGTVISNVAYKYHDGYKMISKGNAVKGEDDDFCRVWTKDYGYDRYGRLVRYKGIQDTQRRIPGSVIRSQMMLNIAPTRDSEGKPINFGEQDGKLVSKYMFSIENLAWKGSDKLKERPICEQGENGGRIMWFPPYDLKYTDDNRANWTSHTFLGRPEPIYTYNNAERSGTINFKVVVDHPSIFNMLRKKLEKGYTSEQKQQIMDSFIAGCRDFDMYDLAKEFDTLDGTEIKTLEEFLNENNSGNLKLETESQGEPRVVSEMEETKTEIVPKFKEKYGVEKDIRLYWFNDIPGPQSSGAVEPNSEFESDLDSYLSMFSSGDYISKGQSLSGSSQTHVVWGDEINEFQGILQNIKKEVAEVKKIVKETLDQDERFGFEITLEATTSAVASQAYNDALAKRRAESLRRYLLGDDYADQPERVKVTIRSTGENTDFQGINCNEIQINDDTNTGVDARIYSKSATYCRTALSNIKVTGEAFNVEIKPEETEPTYKYDKTNQPIQTAGRDEDPFKLLLKSMHSECDYFYELKESDPLVFDNLVDKLKYFQPGFHSTTPEGLNKRLTFLQQCLRPGETIKVFDEQSNEITDISSNTSFGRPPVCILRIGDFFHTKMVVDSINFSYDDSTWDMNPEGIGMQPMIASVNMGVKFIGGHGIGNVINELQNALSFNYYANTEVYDDMATQTEGGRDQKMVEEITKAYDDKLTADYAEVLNNEELSKDSDSFWGNLVETDATKITYNQFYNNLVEKINDYANEVITQTKILTETYGQTVVNPLFHISDKYNYTSIIKTSPTDEVFVPFIGNTTHDYNKDFNDMILNVEDHIEFETFNGDNNPSYKYIENNINFNEQKKETFIDISKFVISEIRKNFSYYGFDINHSLSVIHEKHKTLQKELDAVNIILGDGIDGYNDSNNEWVVRFLNNLTADNGNMGDDVNTALNKLKTLIDDITDYQRGPLNSGGVSLTGNHITTVGSSASLSVEFFYKEILPRFVQQTNFDLDSAISNNNVAFESGQVKRQYKKYLDSLKETVITETFDITKYSWENINKTGLIYDYTLTETNDPDNIFKLKDYYRNEINTIETDEAKYNWKLTPPAPMSSIQALEVFNQINSGGLITI